MDGNDCDRPASHQGRSLVRLQVFGVEVLGVGSGGIGFLLMVYLDKPNAANDGRAVDDSNRRIVCLAAKKAENPDVQFHVGFSRQCEYMVDIHPNHVFRSYPRTCNFNHQCGKRSDHRFSADRNRTNGARPSDREPGVTGLLLWNFDAGVDRCSILLDPRRTDTGVFCGSFISFDLYASVLRLDSLGPLGAGYGNTVVLQTAKNSKIDSCGYCIDGLGMIPAFHRTFGWSQRTQRRGVSRSS